MKGWKIPDWGLLFLMGLYSYSSQSFFIIGLWNHYLIPLLTYSIPISILIIIIICSISLPHYLIPILILIIT